MNWQLILENLDRIMATFLLVSVVLLKAFNRDGDIGSILTLGAGYLFGSITHKN
jgi:hypothetical protein